MNPTAASPDGHDHRVFPDEDLPAGAVIDGDALGSDVDEEVDFVVVGSGAAGSVAAHTLATAGWSVAIVEEGPWLKTRGFTDDSRGDASGGARSSTRRSPGGCPRTSSTSGAATTASEVW